MTLYQIADNYVALLEAIDAGEIPEEALADTLEAAGGAFDEKADNIACLIKNLKAEMKAIKEEESALSQRRKMKERRMSCLHEYLSSMMERTGRNKLETPRNRLSFRQSTAVQIDDQDKIYRTYPEFCSVDVKVLKSKIGDELKNGPEIVGAHLVQKKNLQIR